MESQQEWRVASACLHFSYCLELTWHGGKDNSSPGCCFAVTDGEEKLMARLLLPPQAPATNSRSVPTASVLQSLGWAAYRRPGGSRSPISVVWLFSPGLTHL